MLVTRGLGLGDGGSVVSLGLGLRIIDLTTGVWLHDGTAFRRAKRVDIKHPVDGYVTPQEVWRKTPLGWRRVV